MDRRCCGRATIRHRGAALVCARPKLLPQSCMLAPGHPSNRRDHVPGKITVQSGA